ncbi:hypothetical protein B0H14DRAFT_3136970 [Mycena olivaceomarginata]|nr:hypothetical protein B0H14DRAFT_3136970 [Mycena olivaceomarginata]
MQLKLNCLLLALALVTSASAQGIHCSQFGGTCGGFAGIPCCGTRSVAGWIQMSQMQLVPAAWREMAIAIPRSGALSTTIALQNRPVEKIPESLTERDGSHGTRRTVAMGTVCSPTPELASILEVADHLRAFSQSGMSEQTAVLPGYTPGLGRHVNFTKMSQRNISLESILNLGQIDLELMLSPRDRALPTPELSLKAVFRSCRSFSPKISNPSMVNSLFNLKTVQLALSAPSTGIPLLPGAVFQDPIHCVPFVGCRDVELMLETDVERLIEPESRVERNERQRKEENGELRHPGRCYRLKQQPNKAILQDQDLLPAISSPAFVRDVFLATEGVFSAIESNTLI